MIGFELSDVQEELQTRMRLLAKEELLPCSFETNAERSGSVERCLLNIVGKEGLNAFVIPEEYGGRPLDWLTLSLVTEELSYGSVQLASVYAATIHAASAILIGGSHDLKKESLPLLLNAEGEVASCCVTEEKGGSDTSSFTTVYHTAGDHFILNGTKLPVINAGSAAFYVVWASSDVERGRAGISAFIVPKGIPGLIVDRHCSKGLPSIPTGTVHFNDVKIPRSNLIGLPGSGYLLLMQTIDFGRAFFGAVCVGLARAAIDEATAFAKQRMILNRPIIKNQGVGFVLADLTTRLEASRFLVWRACRLIDLNMDFTTASSMAKLFAAQLAVDATSEGMQILGKKAYSGTSLMCKYQQEAHALRVMEGTEQIQKMIIASQL